MKWFLMLAYALGSMLYLITLFGLFTIVSGSEDSGASGVVSALMIISVIAYFLSMERMRSLLAKQDFTRAYLFGNLVVWVMSFMLYGSCLGAFVPSSF